MKNALPALGVARGRLARRQRTHLRGWERRGGKDTLVRLGGEATPRARAAERACGGRGCWGGGCALGARLPARGGGARTRRARRARPPGWGCAQPRAPNAWVVNVKRIFGTKAEPQRIVATRPLCRVQHPVPHSSRLQGIHRGGPVTCDRVRLRPKLGVLAAERPSR